VALAALSTGNKIGLALVGAAFIVFALVSAFLIPALRPDYPTRRGLPAFLTLTVALFVGMMFAVFFFGRESEEGHAEGGSSEPAAASTTSPSESAVPATTAPATTTTATTTQAAATTAAPKPQSVAVDEKDFKIELDESSFKAGGYRFELENSGPSPHNLVVKGPGVDDQGTPVIDKGKKASLSVKLQSGTYELYCSVPGHKQAGMDLKIKVS
jgi:uncharacterized cupredoxin-like copper-binding protein